MSGFQKLTMRIALAAAVAVPLAAVAIGDQAAALVAIALVTRWLGPTTFALALLAADAVARRR